MHPLDHDIVLLSIIKWDGTLERAVAAARAGFALMDIVENHTNGINELSLPPGAGVNEKESAGLGYAPENVYHEGPNSRTGWSGFDWSAGGALSAAAYLEQHFGAVWADGETKQAIPIDGAVATVVSWDDNRIVLKIGNALDTLQHPFAAPREIRVKFGHLDRPNYDISINGHQFQNRGRQELETGLLIQL
jgi:hypothetical protein